jgi:hypothetical protein
MKKQVLSLCIALVIGTAFAAAQTAGQAPATQPQDKDAPEVSYTGCLIQGSGPSVFVLDRARLDPQSKSEVPRTFLVVEGTQDLMLAKQVNHEVSVRGIAESKSAPTPAQGQKIDEKQLPKLTVKSVDMVSETCTASPRR